MTKHKKLEHPIRWIIWSLAVFFYFYEYFLRVSPSVVVSDLMSIFGISAGVVGLLTAFYFFAYAPMQLPLGILMDLYGARKLLTFASLTCSVGAFLFGSTHSLLVAEAGRFLMGLGSAFAFIGLVYVSSHLFEKTRLALLVGLGNSIGMLGAVFGLGPFSLLETLYGFKETMYTLSLIGLILAIVIYIITRFEPKELVRFEKKKEEKNFLLHLKQTCSNPKTWLIAILAFCFYSITSSYGGLWAVPFYEHGFEMTQHSASFAGSLFFVGWIIAGPIIGHYSDKLKNRKAFLMIFSLLACICMSLIIFIPSWSSIEIQVLTFLLGCFASAQLLCYSLAIEYNTPPSKGTSVAITNFIVFLGGCVLQPLVGVILDYSWDGFYIGNVREYTFQDYQAALTIFPLLLFLSLIFSLFLTKPQKVK